MINERALMNDLNLTQEDVASLQKGQSVENKNVTIRKIAHYYISGGELTERGKQLAEDIFRIMVQDVEVKVREVLSESIKNSHNLPHDIVEQIISDTETVSVPFIKFYNDLTSEDLIKLIETNDLAKQKAVASRHNLQEEVSDTIAQKCNEEVVETLISNDSAQIAEQTYETILKRYKNSENIKEKLIYRPQLPASLINKMVDSLSDELQKRLIMVHDLPENIASDLVEQVKEKSTLKISEDFSSDQQIDDLVRQLYKSDRLTPSLVVRSICMGDLKFFEYSLVYLSNTPLLEVRKILFNNQADFVIRNLLRKAFIPKSMFPAVFSALNVIRDIKFDCGKNAKDSFVHKVIERILSVNNAEEELSESDVNYLISKIS